MTDEKYQEKRKDIEQYFKPENKLSDPKSVKVSPSGNFQIEVSRYSTGPTSWHYSRGIVTRISDDKIVADIKRNYGHFWHAWVNHPNGSEYLLCGEDYQGYSVLNLTTGTYYVYFPEEGHKGAGFCWTAVYPSPDNLILAVDGCYWACPYDLVMYDFRNPEKLPYQEFLRVQNLSECSGWRDNETFSLKQEVEVRKSDGVPYDLLSKEEQDVLDQDPSLSDYRHDTVDCKRPSIANDT